MKLTRFFLTVISISTFVSCTPDGDDSGVKGTYDNGFFILNEGTSSGGSVSFLDNDLMNLKQDVYATENAGDIFGKYVQSIFFNGDNAYVIAGGSNVINVVNRYTFKLIAKIDSGLATPRYGVVKGNKAYVTNANTYSYTNPETGNTDDYVAVIDLTTNKVESKIDLNATANRILIDGDKLFITEPYNNNQLLVVNTTTNSLETPIVIGYNANTMEIQSGTLYVIKSPYGDRSEIVKVKLSDKTTTKITFPATLDGAKNLDIYQNKIYYTVEASVYAMDISATVASETALLTYTSNSAYGKMYGFSVENNRIFISDAGDFTTSGKAYIYSLNGVLQKEITVGVGPNGFYFNN